MTQRTTTRGAFGALALLASLASGCLFEVPFGGDRPDGGNNGGADGGAACRPTGCSGQICADGDRASTCEWREDYACYRTATCERQADGACGWTPTPALRACLANGGPTDGGTPPPVCRTADGRTLGVGETYNDGCNDCTCNASGSFTCTRRACVDAGTPIVCRTPDGRTLRPGETYNDGCNDCGCQPDGQLACTLRACVDAGSPGVCRLPDGRTLRVGESYNDGCNGCVCTASGALACTARACEDAGTPVACRAPDGRALRVGERYYDGCNYCTCVAGGGFSCTERACPDAGTPIAACRPTGCSGQICADGDRASTCEWREEYACYRTATCERQADGACGWTPTPELRACLAGGSVDGGTPPPVCRTADGRTLRVGESYNDGCNDCTCTASGGFACTRRACVDAGAPAPACRRTGCSGQICADGDRASTCEWREEYACYRTAACERQADGQCGWTRTRELEACLGSR